MIFSHIRTQIMNNMRGLWSKVEEQFLIDNYLTLTKDELAEKLNKTKQQVYKKYLKLFKEIHLTTGFKLKGDITEEEMIRGYVAPTYDELSNDEKEIFNNLKKIKLWNKENIWMKIIS